MKSITRSLFFSLICFTLSSQALELYQQECHVIGDDDYVKYSIEADSHFAQGTEFNLKLTAFEDENCENAYLNYNQYFKIKRFVNSNLNLETLKVTYSPLTQEVADSLNLIHYCQQAQWAANTELNVTGLNCDDFIQKAEKEIYFQILKKDSNQLFFGEITNQLNGKTEATRPVDFGLKFTKIFAKPSLNFNRIPLK